MNVNESCKAMCAVECCYTLLSFACCGMIALPWSSKRFLQACITSTAVKRCTREMAYGGKRAYGLVHLQPSIPTLMASS